MQSHNSVSEHRIIPGSSLNQFNTSGIDSQRRCSPPADEFRVERNKDHMRGPTLVSFPARKKRPMTRKQGSGACVHDAQASIFRDFEGHRRANVYNSDMLNEHDVIQLPFGTCSSSTTRLCPFERALEITTR